MATSNLTFEKNSLNRWESKFTSTGGNAVVQLEMNIGGQFVVYANLSGMERVALFSSGRLNMGNVIFEVDVPEGVEVSIECIAESVSGKILS